MPECLWFRVDGRTYAMTVGAIVAFLLRMRNGTPFTELCGCDGCGQVCFEGHLCKCPGHQKRSRVNDEWLAQHRRLASTKDVMARIEAMRKGAA